MEITSNAVQTVSMNQDVLFTETAVAGNSSILHREGSGLVTLRGLSSCQSRARFRVSFGANIAIPADGAVAPISLALSIDGEPINTTSMIYTPTATATYGNVFGAIFIDIPRGCCGRVSVTNTSAAAINVQNANLIVERVA